MAEETLPGEIRVADCEAGEILPGIRNWKGEHFLIVKSVNPVTMDYLYAIGLESGAWVENPDFTVEE